MKFEKCHISDEPVTIEEIEKALAVAAYLVVRYGPVYAPLVDRLERELEDAKRNEPIAKAKRILAEYAKRGMTLENGFGRRSSGRRAEPEPEEGQPSPLALRGRPEARSVAQHPRRRRSPQS